MGNMGLLGRSEEQDTSRFSENVHQSRGAFPHGSGVTQSTEEFKQFVVKEFSKSSDAIEKKFTEFIFARDLKVEELKKEIEKLKHLEEENNRLKKDLNENKRATLKFEEDLKLIIKVKEDRARELEQEVAALRRELDTKNDEILKLNKLVDPMRELRRKGHCIQPGDTMHEDVARDFKQLYDQKRLLEPLGIKEAGKRASELTKILKISYSACKEHLIKVASGELAKLFQPPEKIFSGKERKTENVYLPWQSRQEALSLLLSNLELHHVPKSLIEEVMKNDAMHKYSDVPNVIKRATELTWSMANLSPPVSFESEREFSEDLYDVTDVDNLLGSNDINYVVEYRRPILFFGPLGIVGHRGSVAIHPPESSHDQQHATAYGAQQLEGEDNNTEESQESLHDQQHVTAGTQQLEGISGNKESLHDQQHATEIQQLEGEDNNTEESQESLHDQHHVTGTQQLEGEDNNITKESISGDKESLHDQQHATGAQQLEGEDNNMAKESINGNKDTSIQPPSKLLQECSRDQHNATGAQQLDTAPKAKKKKKRSRKKKNGKTVEVNATDEHSNNGSNKSNKSSDSSDNDID